MISSGIEAQAMNEITTLILWIIHRASVIFFNVQKNMVNWLQLSLYHKQHLKWHMLAANYNYTESKIYFQHLSHSLPISMRSCQFIHIISLQMDKHEKERIKKVLVRRMIRRVRILMFITCFYAETFNFVDSN